MAMKSCNRKNSRQVEAHEVAELEKGHWVFPGKKRKSQNGDEGIKLR